jgi:quercetin dioxygenase-like cupin family protein
MNKIKKDIIAQACLAKPYDLAQSVEYANDAVVSKTLVDKELGTITVFAFDKGQGLSTHSAPYDAVVFVIDGSVQITISEKTTSAAKGQLIVMPANIPHSLQADERFKMLLIMIKQKVENK